MNGLYPVNDLYPAIQGEGALAGTPMILLRLQGCPNHCAWCDTPQTWDARPEDRRAILEEALGSNPRWMLLSGTEIAHQIRQRWPLFSWVLLTGGEPAIHSLGPLLLALHDAGLKVALETSGVGSGHLDLPWDWCCLSPKPTTPQGSSRGCHEIKKVVGTAQDALDFEAFLLQESPDPSARISVQPLDDDPVARSLCVSLCLEKQWNLSLQLHKILGLA